jgi:hypothetical protein
VAINFHAEAKHWRREHTTIMNIEKWKQSFYPIEASELVKSGASELECAKHSLQKWRGLAEIAKELEYDRVMVRNVLVADEIDPSTRNCALCQLHIHQCFDNPADRDNMCSDCILTKLRNGYPCDHVNRKNTDEWQSPYHAFTSHINPKPMIALLEQAVDALSSPATSDTTGMPHASV